MHMCVKARFESSGSETRTLDLAPVNGRLASLQLSNPTPARQVEFTVQCAAQEVSDGRGVQAGFRVLTGEFGSGLAL